MPRPRFAPGVPCSAVLLAAVLFLGLARVALLPPFEGYDETAHYAYVGQVAMTGSWPRRGDGIGDEVDRYLAVAPTAQAMGPKWSYRAFAEAGADDREAGRAFVHAPRMHGPWLPGATPNWEAQHPPLYYLLVAPLYRMSADWSLSARLLLLRSSSYLLAWAGLCLAAYAASARTGADDRPDAVLGVVLWPVLLPEWFPEMARIGNDSLLVPIAGLTWLALRSVVARGRAAPAVGLGLLIGLGLLAKATFLPLAAAVALVLAVWASSGRRQAGRAERLAALAACGLAAAAVAGWWYVGQAIATGGVIGDNDSAVLARQGGLWQGLRQHARPGALLRMFGTFDLSLVWDGSWSFVIPPVAAIAPLMAAVPALVALGLRRRWARLSPLDSLPPLTLALFAAALVHHSLVLIAAGSSGAPAWYLHAFAPVLWPLLAWGVAAARRSTVPRWGLSALIAYAGAFLLAVTLCDAAVYAGCAPPAAEGGRSFVPAEALACLGHPGQLAAALDGLANPVLAAGLFASGAACLVAGVALVLRRLWALPRPETAASP